MSDDKVKWIFPPRRCPRCKRHDSEATHTDGERGIQYRRCRTPLCRAMNVRFSVSGVRVEEAESEESGGPFECPYCTKSYKRQSGLSRHINREHPGETNDGNDGNDASDGDNAGDD